MKGDAWSLRSPDSPVQLQHLLRPDESKYQLVELYQPFDI